MEGKYCIDCKNLEVQPIMAETFMDSGVRVKTGERFYCPKVDRSWHYSKEQMEYVHPYCSNCYEGV